MIRWFHIPVWIVVGGLAFSSCTCQRDLPEPPQSTERNASGFQTSLATRVPRKAEIVEHLSRITPVEPTPPAVQETPPRAAELPENFPTDVPLFEGAETFAVQNLAQGAKNVLFYVDAETPEVFEFYKEGMDKEGWKVTQEAQQKHQSFLSFKKGKMITNMTISKDPKTGRQVVAIMYYEEEELPFPEF